VELAWRHRRYLLAREPRARPAEFFGDEVESLRLFDPTSQRSVAVVSDFDVLPLLAKGSRRAL
jgi:transcription-repair coupling factor (superfamily II helicase)